MNSPKYTLFFVFIALSFMHYDNGMHRLRFSSMRCMQANQSNNLATRFYSSGFYDHRGRKTTILALDAMFVITAGSMGVLVAQGLKRFRDFASEIDDLKMDVDEYRQECNNRNRLVQLRLSLLEQSLGLSIDTGVEESENY